MKQQWVIRAHNIVGEWYYYCENETQGGRMVPNAGSYARKFETREAAIRKAESLSENWNGLKHWQAIGEQY